jgi:hypothetical protein
MAALRQEGSIVRLTAPIHGNAPLKTGLLRHLMKLAEISEDDLRVAEHGALIRLLSRIFRFSRHPLSGKVLA